MPDAAYDYEHQVLRAKLLPDAYNTPCPRCGQLMLKGQDLDLGHSVDVDVDPSSRADRIEHADCNRAAGARDAAERRKFAHSRVW